MLMLRFIIFYFLPIFCCEAVNNLRALTESLGQEVIEMDAPIKELPPEIDEEPAAETESDIKSITSTLSSSTKPAATKDTKRKIKETEQTRSFQEEDEARIEKELSDLYKDSNDYKVDGGEVSKRTDSTMVTSSSATTEDELKPIGRARQEFKFQPDTNNRADVERFRTSVDIISCNKNRLTGAKFEPVPIDKRIYGKFYNGDSYIVLKTTGEVSLSYDAHYWLGSKTSQDKKGSAAIWTVTLDDMLGGRAVHHREVQGHESSQFLGYFQPAIRYLEGGNDSGFNEVETNAGAEKRLLKLSGCENMRIEEVPADCSSLTRDHCFILEVDHDIFVLMPEGAKATQRRKIISVANTLRDDYHNGRATIEIIDDFSSDDDVAMFFEALGSGSLEELIEEESSQTYNREDLTAVYLYRVLTGEELELISLSKPYKQRHLSSAEVYILDTPCSGVYVWLGKEVDIELKKNYNEIAQKYLDMKGYPSWVHVTRVAEGNESCTFKQYFHNWDTVSSPSVRSLVSEIDAGYFSGDAEESGAAAKKIGKSAAARGYMPDSGDGSYTVLRISSGDEDDVTEVMVENPILYQSDVYMVKYQYNDANGEDAFVVYVWMGADAEAGDKRAGVEMASQIYQDVDVNVTLVKVPQGKEPKHFLTIFKGNLAVLYGTRADEYKPRNHKNSYEEDGLRLFRVEGTEPGVDMRTVQVPESADVIEDDDVFVLETPDIIYVWSGKESDEKEQQAAMTFVSKIFSDEKEVVVLEQGSEDGDFWEKLGGAPEEKEDASGWRMVVNRRVTTPRTLTAASVSITGKIRFEDLPPNFSQQDLSDDGVYILDTGEELYFWLGRNTPERIKMAKDNILQEYIADDGLDRTADTAIVVSVKQGKEPADFKKLFPSWEDDMWDQQASYEQMKNEAKAANST